jgi:hypothetical protein
MLKIINLFKKLFKKAKKGKKPEGKERAEFPPGTKIGLFGHANVGKTVFFTMLFETTRYDPKFKLDTRDHQTAAELVRNWEDMAGLGITVHEGRRMDKRVTRKFPPPTSETKCLSFVAVLNKKTRLPFISMDYRGEIASIHEQPELKEELFKFLGQSDCLLFFMEPNAIHSEVDCREQIASFNDILQRLSDGDNKGLSLPVGLVITKADRLVDFEDESQTNLIGRTCEYSKAKGFKQFVDQLLEQPQIKRRGRWREEVRTMMNRLRTFFETLSAMNLDFQVFFVSALGNPPLHEVGDKGEVIMAPPRELKPIGIKEPFRWAIRRLLVEKRLATLRKITKWVLALTLIWVLFYSIPNLLNLAFWYPKIDKVEKTIERGGYQNNLAGLEEENLENFRRAYRRYASRRWVNSFFGMGGLKEFANQREIEIALASTSVPGIPEEKPKVEKLSPADSTAVASANERFQNLKELITENANSPEFLLVTAVDSLKAFLQFIKDVEVESKGAKTIIASIKRRVNRYLKKTKCWDEKHSFDINVRGIPKGYSLWVFSGGKKKGKIFPEAPKFPNIPWTKEHDVIYALENERTFEISESVNLGRFGILKSSVRFPLLNCELTLKIEGFDCKLPQPKDL